MCKLIMKIGKIYNIAVLIFCISMLMGCQEDNSNIILIDKSNLSATQSPGISSEQTSPGPDLKNTQEIIEIIDSYYLKLEPDNKGKLELFLTKDYKNGKLVISRKHYGDGHSFINLLFVNSNGEVVTLGNDYSPMSMCFSVKVANYDGATFVFGIFNNEKWDFKQDKKVKVDITKAKAAFQNGDSFEEKVSMNEGYIIYSNKDTKLKDLHFFNDEGELQSSLEEYGYDITK